MITFWRNFVKNIFGNFWFWQFPMCFFKVKHSIGHISGTVTQTDVKRKGGASVAYLVNYFTLTSPITLTFDFLKIKFLNSSMSGIVI